MKKELREREERWRKEREEMEGVIKALERRVRDLEERGEGIQVLRICDAKVDKKRMLGIG